VIEINQARAQAGSVTPTDLPGFPVTLAAPGSYVLTGNLNVSDVNVSAIEITSDNVTLDLNGFVLSGITNCTGDGGAITCSPQGSGVGVLAISREGIVIRNGSVTGFGSGGIILFMVESCQLTNLTLVANASNAIRVGGSCEISGVIIDRNSGMGIQAFTNEPSPADSEIDDVVTRESVITRNGHEGIFTTSSAGRDRFVVLRTAIRGNGDNGLDLRTEGDVRDCAIRSNAGGGINLGVDSSLPDSGLVRGNAVTENAYGFALDPVYVGYTHNNFNANTAASSGGVQVGPNVCEGDTVCP
jgi:hypothetical protein